MTRIGAEPLREKLMKAAMVKAESAPDTFDGILGLHSMHYETMIRFLAYLEDTYEHSAEGYVKTVLGFSEGDGVIMR